MDSEVDLDVAIKELHVLATAPSLYADFVKLNSVRTVGRVTYFLSLWESVWLWSIHSLLCLPFARQVSLLQHENNDILVDAINLIYELTQSNEAVNEEDDNAALIFHQTFVVRSLVSISQEWMIT